MSYVLANKIRSLETHLSALIERVGRLEKELEKELGYNILPQSLFADTDRIESLLLNSENDLLRIRWGGTNKKLAGRELDGREWLEFPR